MWPEVAVTDAVILPFPVPIDRSLWLLRARVQSVACPSCHTGPNRRCTLGPRSPVIRLRGPHPDRIAAADAALESRKE